MKAIWDRIEAWHQKHGADLKLRPPADAAAIAQAEQAMGLTFPDDFRASLAVHDGQETGAEVPWCPASNPLASIDRIVEQWNSEKEMAQDTDGAPLDLLDRFINVLHHPGRIPIAGTAWFDGDNTYLDLHPGPAGAPGQVVTMTSECDFVLLDESFEKFLSRYADALESGKLVWDGSRVVPSGGGWSGHPADELCLVNFSGLRAV